jgi:hypothetical protein
MSPPDSLETNTASEAEGLLGLSLVTDPHKEVGLPRRKRWVAVGLCASLLLVTSVALSWWLWREYNSLSLWVDRVRRPGYVLLYSAKAVDGSYFAVFDAGNDTMAFCSREKTRTGVTMNHLELDDEEGIGVLDSAKGLSSLPRNVNLGLLRYAIDDGMVVGIRPGFRGKIRLKYWLEFDRVLLDAEISWHEE